MPETSLDRRSFLKTASASTLSALAAGAPKVGAVTEGGSEPKVPEVPPTADQVIVLWMAGGMAHTETFDPKRYVPFEKGMKAEDVLSTFPAIDTAVEGVKISKGLENIASVLDRGTLIRSHYAADLGFILHSRHQFHWHTGYEPPLSVAAPHIGAWTGFARGPLNPDLPPYIDIGQRYSGNGEAEELQAFQTGGILGREYGPFRIPEPAQAARAVRPPGGMSRKRFKRRYDAYKKLVEASPIHGEASGYQRQSLRRSLDSAYAMLSSPAAKAFDLSREPKESYERYNTGRFGLGCLLARRLNEAGARFIEVTSEYIPFKYWDTHDNGHTRTAKLKESVDRPIATLIRDLERRGRLDRTLIVLASEFSRDALIEGKSDNPVKDQVSQPKTIDKLKHYGMHRHFTGAGSALLIGGGAKRGMVYGRTADERPCTAVENPVSVTDLHATIYRAIGVTPTFNVVHEERPFYVTNEGHGHPIDDVLDV